MRTNYFLIDFENVQPDSLAALGDDAVRVLVFVGANQAKGKIRFELVEALQRMGERARYIPMAGNGPNALDFHIAYYLGRLAVEEPTAYFHVISKDTGFDPLIEHLKTQKIAVSRSPTVEATPYVQLATLGDPSDRARLVMERLSQPKATRPRTYQTLSNHVAFLFQKRLTEVEVAAVIKSLQESGFIAVADGKIGYRGGTGPTRRGTASVAPSG
jgi:hypothetical protein